MTEEAERLRGVACAGGDFPGPEKGRELEELKAVGEHPGFAL